MRTWTVAVAIALTAMTASCGGDEAVNSPITDTPREPVLNPWAWAPMTARSMPPARPS